MIDKHRVGSLGEELVARFLVQRGYKIVGRNFRRAWGELDVVAERKGKIHFVEVKSVSYEINLSMSSSEKGPQLVNTDVTQETLSKELYNVSLAAEKKPKDQNNLKDIFRPEDNVSPEKVRRLKRIIQTYLGRVSNETPWQFDVATVLLDTKFKKAKINFIEDLIL